MGKDFTLAFGETVFLKGTGLAVTFRAVLEDSRCPVNAYCVWAGNARLELSVARGDSAVRVVLNTLLDPTAVTVDAHELRLLSLSPQPYAGRTIPPDRYVATLRVIALPPGVFVVDGTVRFLPVEGGCWSIEGTNGRRYEPINLPAEFRHDGLPVRAMLKARPDLASVCMVGESVEILEIRHRLGG